MTDLIAKLQRNAANLRSLTTAPSTISSAAEAMDSAVLALQEAERLRTALQARADLAASREAQAHAERSEAEVVARWERMSDARDAAIGRAYAAERERDQLLTAMIGLSPSAANRPARPTVESVIADANYDVGRLIESNAKEEAHAEAAERDRDEARARVATLEDALLELRNLMPTEAARVEAALASAAPSPQGERPTPPR